MATPVAPSEQNPAIVYREIMGECQRLMQKIAELDVDRNEHSLVEETLKPLDPKRRAYRLVGEVLVERTVEEVLPSVTGNRENVSVNECSVVLLCSNWRMLSGPSLFCSFNCTCRSLSG